MKIIVGNVYCRIVPDDGDIVIKRENNLPQHVLPTELWEDFRLRRPGSEFGQQTVPQAQFTEFINRKTGRFGIGLLGHVQKWLDERRLFYTVEDLRTNLVPSVELKSDLLPGVTMRDYQIEALQSCMKYQNGLISSPTASGKTVELAAIPLIYEKTKDGRPVRHLYILDRVSLARQTVRRFLEYGIPRKDLCLVTGDSYQEGTNSASHYDLNRIKESRIVICMTQMATTVMKGHWDSFDGIEVDESHHARGGGLRSQLRFAKRARIRLGFSGTPLEGQWGYLHDDFQRQRYIGPVIYYVSTKKLIDEGFLAKPIIRFIEVGRNDLAMHAANGYPEVYETGVVKYDLRNDIISMLIRGILGRTLILYKSLDHGVEIMRRLGYKPNEIRHIKKKDGDMRDIPVFHPIRRWIKGAEKSPPKQVFQMDGQTDYSVRDKLIAAFSKSLHAVLIASTIFDEGLDLKEGLNNLIIAGGEKSYIKQIQRLGRGLRPNDIGLIHVFDFTDRSHNTLLEHSYLRAAIWSDQGHEVIPIRFEDL